jgi:AraC-like DNA-binding protein
LHPEDRAHAGRTAWRASQDGQALCLQPGDAVLVDSSRPYEFHFDQGVSCLSIQIPRAWLGQWLSQPETRGLRHTRASQGWGRSLAALGQQWVGDLASARDLPEQVLTDHLGALLSASFNPAPPACAPTAAQSDLAARALRQLQQDLASPGLTAPVVAQRLGVSTRTLHRCLAQAGHSFVQCLHRLRIQQACHMLDQPRLRHLMVGEVGRRCGFADASHFIRVFRQITGHTPEAWRQRSHTTR